MARWAFRKMGTIIDVRFALRVLMLCDSSKMTTLNPWNEHSQQKV
jgi:hypothetical protein